MGKRTFNAKEVLADIKAGMDKAALMEKYGLSDKGLQSVFKKLTDAGVLMQVAGLGYPANIHSQEMVQFKH